MLRKWLRYFLLSLVLLLVFLASALLAMRLAIHGSEVHVPKLGGLTPAEAERVANRNGLVLSVESHFYTPSVPEGRIVSQSPLPGTLVRTGWEVMVAESLGPQRAAVPNLAGESEHAAEVNLSRRGLRVGSVAAIHFPGVQPGAVLAQSPPPGADTPSPKINLIVAADDSGETFVMPDFTGKPLDEVARSLEDQGFTVSAEPGLAGASGADGASSATGTIVRQNPAAGRKVEAGATVHFEVTK